MLDRVVGEQRLTGLPSGDWATDLTAIAQELRATALRHPWSILPPARPMLGPNGMRRLETALSIFGTTAVTIDRRAWAVGVVDAFVRGSVSAELAAQNEQLRTGIDAQRWQRAIEPYITRMLATGEYPMIAKYTAEADDADPATAFQAGVDAVISGIKAVAPLSSAEASVDASRVDLGFANPTTPAGPGGCASAPFRCLGSQSAIDK
jgi:hypothetical protein